MEEYGENERKDEILLDDHKPVPMNIASKIMKSICKIIIKGINGYTSYETGFFMKISDSLKCLITCYHVISPNVINQNIEIEIFNKNKMKLNISNRYIEYFPEPKDTTIIQIKNTDIIFNDIEFLGYDSNYKYGYDIYKNIDICTVEYSLGKYASCASGRIVDINKYEFDHNIPTEQGCAGCPIILLNNNINLIQVIGMHKEVDFDDNVNVGIFIGEIINYIDNNYINIKNDNNIIGNNFNNKDNYNYDTNNLNQGNLKDFEDIKMKNNNIKNNLNLEINKKILENEKYYIDEENVEILNKIKADNKDKKENINSIDNIDNNSIEEEGNYIISEIYVNDNNINNEIRIINSFEEWMRSQVFLLNYFDKYKEDNYKNENEIKECTIKINNISIPFSYKYKFTKLGKNIIKYKFKNLLTKTVLLFADCNSLTYIDLSHFNTKDVDNMFGMFINCISLTEINLNNFNTKNVTDICSIFAGCKSLSEIDLYNFETKNIKNMRGMFSGCTSLIHLDLLNFNTENVKDMYGLFSNCKSLLSINLSSFNTKNVTDMSYMFNGCNSLENIDLSNFNTENITSMNSMFYGCNSIKDLNLSYFITRNSTKLDDLFTNAKLIEGGKIIIHDDRIKQKLKEATNFKNFNEFHY